MTFEDREDAGRQLGQALLDYRDQDVVVLELPRGGVPVGVPGGQVAGCAARRRRDDAEQP